MKKIPACTDVLDPSEPVLPVPDVAERLDVPVTRVHAMLQERTILAVQRDNIAQVPERMLTETEVNRFLPGVLALMHDGNYSDEETLDWLFTEDDTLPGRPIDALHGHLAREVRRRAQAMAL
ncbi:DNA-binding protein [Corynebacterium sp. TAE3-ERU12]|uniref:Rv2175c family DNA-binding protein n=1 Tax=Corynebacterium sp. TAE3-ERU12 TaxID=2849491 RepID=UPI001C494842|nr:DNA-binding protein [Corynebacterium sp. TAE3-ERU12]